MKKVLFMVILGLLVSSALVGSGSEVTFLSFLSGLFMILTFFGIIFMVVGFLFIKSAEKKPIFLFAKTSVVFLAVATVLALILFVTISDFNNWNLMVIIVLVFSVFIVRSMKRSRTNH